MFLAVDPQGQFASPYLAFGNNPVNFIDPDGELAWFVPLIIGAVIGGTAGGIQAYNNPNMSIGAGILLGATVGGLSGGAAAGVSALGAGAMLAGAAGGAVGGAGYSGMATGWDAQAMLRGSAIGAASGFVGGGFAAAIGGSGGTFVGGAAADITGQLLVAGNVDFGRAGITGAMGLGMYIGASYLSYLASNEMVGGYWVKFRQWLTIQADFQRSRFWKKEFGGVLTNDGKVTRVKRPNRHYSAIEFPSMKELGIDIDDVLFTYHTHHIKPEITIYTDYKGDRLNPNISKVSGIKSVRYHSPSDLKRPFPSLVVNRFDSSINYNHLGPGYTFIISNTYKPFTDGFLRFFLNFNFRY